MSIPITVTKATGVHKRVALPEAIGVIRITKMIATPISSNYWSSLYQDCPSLIFVKFSINLDMDVASSAAHSIL